MAIDSGSNGDADRVLDVIVRRVIDRLMTDGMLQTIEQKLLDQALAKLVGATSASIEGAIALLNEELCEKLDKLLDLMHELDSRLTALESRDDGENWKR